MKDWFKPEHLITAVIALVGWGLIYVSAVKDDSKHSTATDITMTQVLARLDRIDTAVSGVPLYAQRLTQLEGWKDQRLSWEGDIAGRMNSAENKYNLMQFKLDDIQRASQAKLR